MIYSEGRDGSSAYAASLRAVMALVSPGASREESQRALDEYGRRIDPVLVTTVRYFERAIAGFLERHAAFGKVVPALRAGTTHP